MLERARDDLEAGASPAIARAAIWGSATALILLALALAFALWPRARGARWVLPAMTAGALVVTVGGSITLARASFDEVALENPTYFARGAELARLLAAAEAERVDSGYGSEVESILRSVSAVLSDEPIRAQSGRELFLASDLHANALVIDPLASFFDGAPLIFAGDFGQRGTAAEAALLARKVAALGERVLVASGNHDSAELIHRLVDAGASAVDRPSDTEGAIVDGLRIVGYPDPFEGRATNLADPERPITFDDLPDPEVAAEAVAANLRTWFDGLAQPADIVVVHQNQLAQNLADSLWRDDYAQPLTIVTGHDHSQHVDRYGPITVVDGGTVGAGGIFEAGTAFAGFAELHFDETEPRLRSVDLVAVEPFSGRGRGSRVVIDTICPEEDRCSFTPLEPEIDVPGS